ncbi:MAG TPA: hypothetical protein PL005_06905 [Candidatus Hydrogenedentes bacterium]|nr:hypothetical protein [Candidatus Hydrogenedentota bacterium]
MKQNRTQRTVFVVWAACALAGALLCQAVLPGPSPLLSPTGSPAVPEDQPGVCPVPALEVSVGAPAPARSRAPLSAPAAQAFQGMPPSSGRCVGQGILSGLRPGHNRSLLLLKRQLLI